jgi:hypothetical protein
MYVRAPEPLGYDPAGIWGAVANPEFGVLMLQPWRVELVPAARSFAKYESETLPAASSWPLYPSDRYTLWAAYG